MTHLSPFTTLFFGIGRILADKFKVQQDLDRQKPRRELAVERSHSPGKVSDQATTIDRDYDEGEGSDESSEDEEALMSYQQDSISIIVLENAKLIIDRLYKLSFKIRTLPRSTGTEDEVSMEGTDSKGANEECSYRDSGVHSSVVADEKAYDSFSSGEESILESTATSESRDTGAAFDTGTSGQSQGKGSFLSTPARSLRPPPPVPGSPGMGGLAEGSGHNSIVRPVFIIANLVVLTVGSRIHPVLPFFPINRNTRVDTKINTGIKPAGLINSTLIFTKPNEVLILKNFTLHPLLASTPAGIPTAATSAPALRTSRAI